MKKINVVVWSEYRHERKPGAAQDTYPGGLHATIKEFLDVNEDMEVTLACLDDPDQGLSDERLANTDVLLWWGHTAHREVSDELAEKIRERVYLGKMGLIALHSAHKSKPFMNTVGTNGNLSWGREQREVMWNIMPSHEIAAGIPDHFVLESEELYSEPFFIPQPDELVFGSWFEDGNIFRSGACFRRGAGKVFYFQPGHETCRSYYNPYVQRIITKAVRWAKPANAGFEITRRCPQLLTRSDIVEE